MSLSDFTQKIEGLYQIINLMKEKFASETEKLKTLDVSSPTALEEWQTLRTGINTFTSQQVAEYDTIIKEANAIRTGLSKEDEVQANELARTVRSQFDALIPVRKDVVASFADVKKKIDSGKKETNPSEADRASQEKVASAGLAAASTSEQSSTDAQSQNDLAERNQTSSIGRTLPVPPGAIPARPTPASVNQRNIAGDKPPEDMRVKIRVPKNYLTTLTKGPGNSGVLNTLGGIIFPYTPQISLEHKAEYSAQQPVHSNFTQYFYQKSYVSPINITGKFSVANEDEAMIYIATLHLLRALTKMRSGGITGDADSGAPPPVCRLDAYGTFMLHNVPVSISSFKIDLPENIDYFTVGKLSNSQANKLYEKTAVPVLSTISINCLPMYSRDEMQKFSVTGWLNDKFVRKAGYL